MVVLVECGGSDALLLKPPPSLRRRGPGKERESAGMAAGMHLHTSTRDRHHAIKGSSLIVLSYL